MFASNGVYAMDQGTCTSLVRIPTSASILLLLLLFARIEEEGEEVGRKR
jgi:hypothetical protein